MHLHGLPQFIRVIQLHSIPVPPTDLTRWFGFFPEENAAFALSVNTVDTPAYNCLKYLLCDLILDDVADDYSFLIDAYKRSVNLGPDYTEEEKKTIKKMVIDRVNGRIPILLGVGGNNTRAIVETLKNDDFTGVDAILSVVPYYNKPSQEGIYQHYKAIAEATELPIVLYNVPGRTGVNMTAETTLRIARDFKNVVAIKEASGNITQMDDIIKNKPEIQCNLRR